MADQVNIDDCRIEWFRGGIGLKSLLRVTHLKTGHQVQRPAELKDDWKLDDALRDLQAVIDRNNT